MMMWWRKKQARARALQYEVGHQQVSETVSNKNKKNVVLILVRAACEEVSSHAKIKMQSNHNRHVNLFEESGMAE